MKRKATKLFWALFIVAMVAGFAICGIPSHKGSINLAALRDKRNFCNQAIAGHKGAQSTENSKFSVLEKSSPDVQPQRRSLAETYKEQLEQCKVFQKAVDVHEGLFSAYASGSSDTAGLIEQCKAEEDNAKNALAILAKLRDERIAIFSAKNETSAVEAEKAFYNGWENTLELLTVDPLDDNKLLKSAKKAQEELDKQLAATEQTMGSIATADLTPEDKAVLTNEVIPEGQNVQKGLGDFLNELVKVAQQIVQVVQQLQSGGAKGLGIGMAKSLISGGKSGTNPIAIINSVTKLFNSLAESTVSMNKSINGYNQAAGKLAGVEVAAAPELQAPDFSQILKLAH